MFRYSPLFALALTALGIPVLAQPEYRQLNRREQDDPEIVVEAGGRYGTCDTIQFSPDGSYLLAGGDDKVARLWPYTTSDGLKSGPDDAKILRWPSWREQRGGVKCLAISPDGSRVAIGGYGLKPSTVAILDRNSGAILGLTWPNSRNGVDNFNVVHAVAFHPNGKDVAFGTADGSLWLWKPVKLKEADSKGREFNAPLRAGKHEPQEGAQFNFPRRIVFPDANTLVSVAQNGQVLQCDLAGNLTDDPKAEVPVGKSLMNFAGKDPQKRAYRVNLSVDGKKWIVACQGPRVLLVPLNGAPPTELPLGNDDIPWSISQHPKTGVLAVGVVTIHSEDKSKPRFYSEKKNRIQLYDPAKGLIPSDTFDFPGKPEAIAFHPVDNRLAIAGGDADEVTLLDPAKPKAPLSIIRSAGRKPWSLRLSTSGDVLGLQNSYDANSTNPNARGSGDWYRFDLKRLTVTDDAKIEWVEPKATADGWSIEPDSMSRFVWYAVLARPGADPIRYRLNIETDFDLAPTCYGFIAETENDPTRVIVGHGYGCSLFEMDPRLATEITEPVHGVPTKHKLLRKARMFTGHSAEVASIAIAKDGTWFVSGGADQTISAFSLKKWASHPTLGATVEVQNGVPVVSAVDTGSPAWEAGLSVGNKIELLAVGGKDVVYSRVGKEMIGQANDVLAALKNPKPGHQLFFDIGFNAKENKRLGTITSVRQRPLWKFFPAYRKDRISDWCLWMWQGSRYVSDTANGDSLVGWHVNASTSAGQPRFFKLAQFERLFQSEPVITKLIAERDMAAALKDALGENPVPVQFSQFQPAPITLGLQQSIIKGQGIDLELKVEKLKPSDPDLLPERIELWVNDYRYKVWDGLLLEPFKQNLKIPAGVFRNGQNQITVLTFNRSGGREERLDTVSNLLPPEKSDLLGEAMGVNDYSEHRKIAAGVAPLSDLKVARKDAEELRDSFHNYRGDKKFFPKGEILVKADAFAKQKSLITSLKKYETTAKPNDLLVVFVAAHGELPDEKLGVVIPAGPLGARGAFAANSKEMFFICGPDYSRKNLAKTAISSEELFDALVQINCRKLVLLDACHSGQARDSNMLRRFVPNGQGPIVIAACEQGEVSYENEKLGHGLFTQAILDALGTQYAHAAGRGGSLTAKGLFEYVEGRVPDLLVNIGRKRGIQNPICYPRELPATVLLKP